MKIKAIHYKEDRKIYPNSDYYPYLIIFDKQGAQGYTFLSVMLQRTILDTKNAAHLCQVGPKFRTEDDSRLGKEITWEDLPIPHQTLIKVLMLNKDKLHSTIKAHEARNTIRKTK